MSITKAQASEFLASAPHSMRAAGGASMSDDKFQECCNELANTGTGWADIFTKAFAIYHIVAGPGTLEEKIKAIFALFQKTPPASLLK